MTCKIRIQNKFISFLTVGIGGIFTFGGICYFKGDEKFYSKLLMPIIHKTLDEEKAHKLAIKVAKYGLVPVLREDTTKLPLLKTTLWGLEFNNPIGLAAGFDKDGEAVNGLSKLGFGFVEIGSVTPEPQPGNNKPRIFRLLQDKAIINRYGFNSSGHSIVKNNLLNQEKSLTSTIVGVNLGKNKNSTDADQDYIKGILNFSDLNFVHYLVVNISSPNTPNLTSLQNKNQLCELIDKILKVKNQHNIKKPLLIKISSDLNENQLKDIANIINKFSKNKFENQINGVIISNTTINRPNSLKSDTNLINQEGGLSGSPIKDQSTQAIKLMYKLTNGKIPIIGVGGTFTGQDAYEKIKAGASLIQIYTSLIYEGPPVVKKIKNQLSNLLISDGFNNVSEAVGIDSKKIS